MWTVELTEQDVVEARGGRTMRLPLSDGGFAVLEFRRNAYHLRPFVRGATLEWGEAPGEGAVAETPRDTPQ